MQKKILYVVSDEKYFFSHRFSLAVKMQESGYQVAVALPHPRRSEDIKKKGMELFPLSSFHRSSLSPLCALRSFWELCALYRTFRPDVVHHVALKISLLGTLAAQTTKVPIIVNAVAGMGYLFTQGQETSRIKGMIKKGLGALVTLGIKKMSKRHSKPHFIVQNQDDETALRTFSTQVILIPGVGVSLVEYPFMPLPESPPVRVVFLARLLKEKGVFDFLKAAHILYEQHLERGIEFVIYGGVDPHNPGSLSLGEIERYVNQDQHSGPLIRFAGVADSSAQAYRDSHIVVLPSYREGLPKSLLEAASCGRPIITTDVPGCRDVVIPEVTGLLVPVGNPMYLAQAIGRLAHDRGRQIEMGERGHAYIKAHYEESLIHQKFIDVFNRLS
jgi:glycosyltransferase involved in cell wall biosynthesis